MNPSSINPRKILLVEDDACTAVLFKSLLTREGYTVQHSTDGEAALQVLWQNRFDAVVLDLMMPKLDGVQVLKAMRSMPDHLSTPVLVLSAAKLKMVEEEALRYGAKMFLDKTQTDKLITTLRQIFSEASGPAGAGLRMAPLAPLQENAKVPATPSGAGDNRVSSNRISSFFTSKSAPV
jgi:CheY-like chemotaxis protein